jgi:hypothetical protein
MSGRSRSSSVHCTWDDPIMPNLDFYAAEDDWPAVLEIVFGLGLFRVLESNSEPDRELRVFETAAEVPADREACFGVGRGCARTR